MPAAEFADASGATDRPGEGPNTAHGPMPGTWDAGMNWGPEDDARMASVSQETLQQFYADQTVQLQFPQEGHVPLHWAITSCRRPNWGRVLTTTLLSGLLNGLQPETITVVWCHPYNTSEVSSLLYNLRHSHKLRVVYVSPNLPVHPATTYLTALMVPQLYRGSPDMHLLVTEDDVVFTLDVNAKLYELVDKVKAKAKDVPHLLNLYNPPRELPATTAETLRRYNPGTRSHMRFPGTPYSKAGTIAQSPMSYWYGAQATLFSPDMQRLMAKYFFQVVTGRLNVTDGFTITQDHGVKDFLVRYNCAFSFDQHAPCQVFNVEPSLVQHVGTSSATLQENKKALNKFHMAVDFPVHVGLPGLDDPTLW